MIHAGMKLGRIRPSSRQRAMAPRFKDFVTAPLPPAPEEFHGDEGAAIGMWGNDEYGDCVVAGAANYRAIRAARMGLPPPPTTRKAVVSQYLALTGGQDSGLVETDFLTAAMGGVELGGDERWVAAVWTSVDMRDVATCRALIAIFGALYLGVELPLDAQGQDVWTPTTGRGGAPGGWGGHCLLWSGYGPKGDELPTWGARKYASTDWLPEYVDEGHVIVDADSAAVAGIDFEKLVAYARETAQMVGSSRVVVAGRIDPAPAGPLDPDAPDGQGLP